MLEICPNIKPKCYHRRTSAPDKIVKLNLIYYYKVKTKLQNLAFKFTTPEQETLDENKTSLPSFAIRNQKIRTKIT